MSIVPENSDRSDDGDHARKRKREYVRPAFRHEQVFETMALACGKLAGTSQACDDVVKLS